MSEAIGHSGTSDEEAEAMESWPAVAEIHFHKIRLTVKGESTRVLFH